MLPVAQRRGRISADETMELLDALNDLPIRTDTTPDLAAALVLAGTHDLSFYDALYLELAQRHTGTLAALDSALARAAGSAGLPVSP